ncbi:cohesin complex subunit SCC1 [Entomortierella parvispora]|uniref:Cohesin complex subunit SCC1 n=1 Tax=Entomortierella parvispora TaxID=205924 RepID=A0A9P3M154_9FUNG|nr:cohesin complex subunit SCC1 [Entomortierella parvispora]
MFYSEAILSKKGPLAKVWLAAHWERKLSKNQLLQTNLNSSVDAIMGADQAPMALRLSGQLLLGVARIYSRKTKYLLEDCNEALVKIKVAFRTDANGKGDSTLLMLDGTSGDLPAEQSLAAFNAITVPDAMTEFDLRLPAQTIDLNAWGLNSKLTQARGLDADNNADDLTMEDDANFNLDHSRRHRGLDIEMGRNIMNRIGGGRGYSAMDFDLAGPDDALDLDMFGEDLVGAGDIDFLRRPHNRDDLEIEVGRDAGIQRRSVSVDPFGMLSENAKDRVLNLGEGSEDGRAMSVNPQDDVGFEMAAQDGARPPLDFDFADAWDAEGVPAVERPERQQAGAKKRKLVVDAETTMPRDVLMGTNLDMVADGLLMNHEMLPRSRKMLRLQQIEQDVARGGLAGYLLDCSGGPRVMGSSLVPELASMFSRRLQIDQAVPAAREVQDINQADRWQDDQQDAWANQADDHGDAFDLQQATPPPADMFDGFRLESPEGVAAEDENATAQISSADTRPKGTLFQEMDDSASTEAGASTKELNGTVFSHSAIQTMRLVQQRIESQKTAKGQSESESSSRATRNASVATASSALNKDTSRVTFSELMAGPSGASQQKRTRTDAAKLFFELLVLSTKDVVKVEQEESFGEIAVGGSPWLDTLVEADSNTEEQHPVEVESY